MQLVSLELCELLWRKQQLYFNNHLFLLFRSFERTAPIFFHKLLTKDDDEESKFSDERNEMFALANTHSLIDVIRMGTSLSRESINLHSAFFKPELGGLVKRLPDSYACYRLFFHQVSRNRRES